MRVARCSASRGISLRVQISPPSLVEGSPSKRYNDESLLHFEVAVLFYVVIPKRAFSRPDEGRTPFSESRDLSSCADFAGQSCQRLPEQKIQRRIFPAFRSCCSFLRCHPETS